MEDQIMEVLQTVTATVFSPVAGVLREQLAGFQTDRLGQWAITMMADYGVRAAMGILLAIAAYFVAKLISRQVSGLVCRKVDETLGRFVAKFIFYSILLVVASVALPILGIQVSGIMAILATAGFAVGLAFQGTLSNFSSGVLLMVFRPFKVGDMVNVAGISGKVNEIDLFTTTVDTPDNRRIIVPNSSIASGTIENISYHRHRRVEVNVGVEYSASLDRTRAALVASAESISDATIQGEGRGYQVVLAELGASSVNWTVRMWVDKDQFFPVRERLTAEIKRQLDQQNIGIPFPQLEVHWSGSSNARESAGFRLPENPLTMPNIHSSESPQPRIRPRVRGDAIERAVDR